MSGFLSLLDHAEELGIDSRRVGVAGTSAGAALAVGMTLRLRDQIASLRAFLLLDAPSLDDRQLTPSSAWDVPIADPATIRLGWRAYLGDLYGASDVPAYAAPARADDLRRFPPTFISVGSVDGLHDEAVAFAERLANAGAETELQIYDGGVHNFASLAPASRLARRQRDDQNRWLQQIIGRFA